MRWINMKDNKKKTRRNNKFRFKHRGFIAIGTKHLRDKHEDKDHDTKIDDKTEETK